MIGDDLVRIMGKNLGSSGKINKQIFECSQCSDFSQYYLKLLMTNSRAECTTINQLIYLCKILESSSN